MLFGLLPGTLDVLVLRALDEKPTHGYGVARWVRDATDGELNIEEGALYTALHRLEKRGLLRADWRRTAGALSKALDGGRRAARKASS